MSRESLLTGRHLVTALASEGIGTWSADAVRQWIREDNPAPIAEHADQGKPHRYRLTDILAWLRQRALTERAKGYTRGDGDDLVQRIDAALARQEEPSSTDLKSQPATEKNRADTSAPSRAEARAASKPIAPPPDWIDISDVDALLNVLQGRDPRNWKAAEEALNIRRERLEAERRLIPVDELDQALEANVEHTRHGIHTVRAKLKQTLRDFISPDRQHQAERVIDGQFDELLQRLASSDDLDGLMAPQSAVPTDASAR